MKKTVLLALILCFNLVKAQIVSIPDSIFKAALISAGVDKNNDGNIQVSEAETTYFLSVNSLNITDLTGIEAFTELEYLDCYENLLTTLNVTANTALNHLDCGSNNLSSLDVSKNTALSVFDCTYNNLTSLDVSKNTELMSLRCNNNNISTLSLDSNAVLKILVCSYNNIDSINIDKNTELTTVDFKNNAVDFINFSKNTALTSINCSYNNLSSISVCYNLSLNFLNCDFNLSIDTVKVNAVHSTLISNYPDNWVKPLDAVWYDGPCTAEPTDTIIGIETIYPSQQTRVLTHIFNILGQEVNQSQTTNGGIYIYLYSDGTVEKRMVLGYYN